MQCELCGRECDCRNATVEGVRMMLCPGCMKQHGRSVKETSHASNVTPMLGRIKRPKQRDVLSEMNKELVSNWNAVIKSAREKKGVSREDLGFKIGERTVTIAKIENGDLRPSDKVARKLEKELDISLFEEVKSATDYPADSHHGSGMTLADFVKRED